MKFRCKCFSKDFCVIYSLVYFCWFVNLLLIQKKKKFKKKKRLIKTKYFTENDIAKFEVIENFILICEGSTLGGNHIANKVLLAI